MATGLENFIDELGGEQSRAAETYRDILIEAHGGPIEGETKDKLRECMKILGKSAADLEADQKTILQSLSLTAQARDADDSELAEQLQQASDALGAHLKLVEKTKLELQRKQAELSSKLSILQQRQNRGRQAARELERLRANRPDLFPPELLPEPSAKADDLMPEPSADPLTPKPATDEDGIPFCGRDCLVTGRPGGAIVEHKTYGELRAEFDADRRKELKCLESLAARCSRLPEDTQRRLEELRERYGQPVTNLEV